MDRGQAATFVAGLWKLNNGDQSGAADLAGINKDLGVLADQQFGRNDKIADIGNKAVTAISTMNYQQGSHHSRGGLAALQNPAGGPLHWRRQ